MKYYLISVTERRFGIFPPCAHLKKETASLDFEPVFLLPSEKNDFEIELVGNGNYDGAYKLSLAAALSAYFFKVRGFPNATIEISNPVLNFMLEKTDKAILKMQKCKYKFSKSSAEISGASVEYLICHDCLIFQTDKVCDFSESVFSLLFLKEKKPHAKALAYSRDGSCVNVKRCGGISSVECAEMISQLLISEGSFGKGETLDFVFESGNNLSIKNLDNSRFEVIFKPELFGFFESP